MHCLYWLHIIYNARSNNSTKQKIKISHTSYIYAKIQSDLPKHDYLSCLPWSRPSRGPSVSASLFGPNTDVWNLEITKKMLDVTYLFLWQNLIKYQYYIFVLLITSSFIYTPPLLFFLFYLV